MARAGEVKVVVSADTRPATSALGELDDRITIAIASSTTERAAAIARMYRRHLVGTADYLRGRRAAHRRLDPRRVRHARLERACRRYAAELDLVLEDRNGTAAP